MQVDGNTPSELSIVHLSYQFFKHSINAQCNNKQIYVDSMPTL
jgi:hypothetical protein